MVETEDYEARMLEYARRQTAALESLRSLGWFALAAIGLAALVVFLLLYGPG